MRDISTKIDGTSTLTAAEFNEMAEELENAIKDGSITLDTGDTSQLSKSMANYVSTGAFYADSGAADAYVLGTVDLFEAPTAYTNGLTVRFRPSNTNTGASTVNVAGLGVKNIKQADGSTDPGAGELVSARDITLIYDGTSFRIPTSEAITAPITPVSPATQLQMEGAGSTTVYSSPGTQQYHPSSSKAWVRYTSVTTTTITSSYNVTSLTDNAVGDTTITFTTAFSSANFAGVASSQAQSGYNYLNMFTTTISGLQPSAPTTTTARITTLTTSGTSQDTVVSAAFYGDQ